MIVSHTCFPGVLNQRALFTDLAELDKLGIQLGRFKLARKPKENITTRVAQTNKLGENEHWSASGLMSHLSLLERIVSQPVKPVHASSLYLSDHLPE